MAISIWIPLLIAAASFAASLILPSIGLSVLPGWTAPWLFLVAAASILWAIFLAYRQRNAATRVAGKGGDAEVSGTDSQAYGGRGGNALRHGIGGDGGDAKAKGSRSTARGGDGGST